MLRLPFQLQRPVRRILLSSIAQFSKTRSPKERQTQKIEDFLGGLDGQQDDDLLPKTAKSKLKARLETKKKRPMDEMEIGMLETRSADILEILNNGLESKAIYGVFKNIPDTSKVVSINHVRCSRDMTHVSAIWGSDLFQDFIQQVKIKNGEKDASSVQAKIYKKTSALLQAKEPAFRTHLMRHMSFRRVPRITFLPPGNELTREEKYEIQMEEWMKEQALQRKKEARWERHHRSEEE